MRTRREGELTVNYLVTGASRGIGRAVAGALICRGDSVSLVSSGAPGQKKCEALLSELSAQGSACAADLKSANERERLVSKLQGERFDGVIHAAGIARHASFENGCEADLRETFEVNFFAPLLLTRALLRSLNEGASIVFLSSTLAQRSAPGTSDYAASKAALESLTRSLAIELAPRHRVNAIAPGLVDTDMANAARTEPNEVLTDIELAARRAEQRTYLESLHLLERFGTPEEAARAVLFVLDHPWMTGTILRLDGGLTLK